MSGVNISPAKETTNMRRDHNAVLSPSAPGTGSNGSEGEIGGGDLAPVGRSRNIDAKIKRVNENREGALGILYISRFFCILKT